MLSLFLSIALAQSCDQLYGKVESGVWYFFPTQEEGTVPVNPEALIGCKADPRRMVLTENEIVFDKTKADLMDAADTAEKAAETRAKFLKEKIKTQKLTEDEKEELLKALVEGK